jgi:hypothetical protein
MHRSRSADFRWPRSRRRQPNPLHSRSSTRLKQETARPPQSPQDAHLSPGDQGFEHLPRPFVESLGIRCAYSFPLANRLGKNPYGACHLARDQGEKMHTQATVEGEYCKSTFSRIEKRILRQGRDRGANWSAVRKLGLGDHPKAATCYHLKSGHSA